MKLLYSTPVPCDDIENSPAVTTLSCTEKYVAVALTDASVRVFSSLDCSHIFGFKDPCGKTIWAIAVVGEEVVVGSSDGALRVWSLNDGTHIQTTPPPSIATAGARPPIIDLMKVLSCGTKPSVLVTTIDGTIRHWTPGSDTYSNSFINGHSGSISIISTFDHDKKFISAGFEGTICAWDVAASSLIWKVDVGAQAFGLGVDDLSVAVGRRDGEVRILGIEDGTAISNFQAHTKVINGLIFHKSNLLSTGTDGFAKIWLLSPSTNTYQLDQSIQLHDHAIMTRNIIGSWLVTGGKNGGGVENACGLDCSVKAWNLNASDVEVVKELGDPVEFVYEVGSLEKQERIVVALRKRGRPALEIWEVSE